MRKVQPIQRRQSSARYHVPPQPLAMTLDTAIAVSGLGRTAIFIAMKEGKLPARKAGKRNIILYEDLMQFLGSLPMREPKE